MINNRDVLQYKSKIIIKYASLDHKLIDHPEIQARLDNVRNLYAYSDKMKLLDTFDMMLTRYNYNDNDLYIRLLHYIAVQHELFTKIKITEGEIIHLIDDIKLLLIGICKEIIQPNIDIEILPAYLKEFYQRVINIAEGMKWNY